MVSQTNEQALEATIEKALSGISRETLKDQVGSGDVVALVQAAQYRSETGHGYQLGWSSDFDREFAVDQDKFWGFLNATQANELAKLKDQPSWQRLVLEHLSKRIRKHGVLKVLKHGLSINDAHFTLLYSAPFNDINPEVAANFEHNVFSVTRQLYYSQANPNLSIDMALFINGLAIATLELKNTWTGQTTYHAMKQYREDRDPNEPLLQFGRCLVHFAVDTDEVYMTTRLAGNRTVFLPFNKGYRQGKGNPPAVKAEIMVSHFMDHVVAAKKLKGKAKGMVVTRSIESAIHYFQMIRRLLGDRNAGFKAVIAFSGKKAVDGVEYTEDSINGFPGKDIEDKFDSDEYRLLVVANKYLTGFDQPKLATMYVDKKLQGVLAVQALSRLNRCNHKLGKRTEDIFVLDFFNTTDTIKKAFDPFYTATSLSSATDVNVLHELKESLDEVGVYEWQEVEAFNALFFRDAPAELLSPIIDTCEDRFTSGLELDDDAKADFKIKAKQFVKIYAQVACILSFDNIVWEKLHWLLKFLIPKLKIKDKDKDALDELLESVDLSTYGLERTRLREEIGLDDSDSELDPQNPNPRGVPPDEPKKDPLDEIIKLFNQRWFQGWDATPEEQRFKFINIARHVMDDPSYETQVVNNPDKQNSQLALEKLIQNAVGKERRRELDLYKSYAQDPEFKRAFDASIARLLSQSDDLVEKLFSDRQV